MNSFQTVLAMTWQAERAGTRIQCRTRMHVIARAFLVIWFSFVGLSGLFVLLAPAEAVEGSRTEALRTIGLMLGYGAAVVGFGRLIARNEEKYLLDFVRYMLDAKPS